MPPTHTAVPSANESPHADARGLDSLGELEQCAVLDARNWSCRTGGTDSLSVFPPGTLRAVDGRFEVTDTKDFIEPESWLARESARLLPAPVARVVRHDVAAEGSLQSRHTALKLIGLAQVGLHVP
jgi:hypothetical protein